jgi:hypothetical protein
VINRKLFHAIWIGAVVLLTLAGIALGLRRGNVASFGRNHVWSVESGTGEDAQAVLVRGRQVENIRGDMNQLMFAFNKVFSKATAGSIRDDESVLELPHLRYLGMAGNSAQAEIVNSVYLTQRMGTSEAQDYLAAATYTITEFPGAAHVYFVFTPGDHASPGLYSRESFSDTYRVVAGGAP